MDEDLERMFRESLARHADEVDVAVEVPTPRRSFPWQGALVAAAVTGMVTAGASLLGHDADPKSSEPPVVAPVPPDWRVESWHDVQVSVPSDWAWGGAPTAHGGRGGGLIDCGASAYETPEGERYPNGDGSRPYVGRPVALTDACRSFTEHTPTASYVWLGVDVEPGIVDLGDGWVQETIEVARETVTVASNDAALRERILSSARAADDSRCPTRVDGWPGTEADRMANPTGGDVCIYERSDQSLRLTYATTIDSARATRLLQVIDEASPYACTDTYADHWALIRLHDASGRRDVVAALDDCTLISTEGKAAALTEETVRPWAVDGVPATAYTGLSEPWAYEYLIGPQG